MNRLRTARSAPWPARPRSAASASSPAPPSASASCRPRPTPGSSSSAPTCGRPPASRPTSSRSPARSGGPRSASAPAQVGLVEHVLAALAGPAHRQLPRRAGRPGAAGPGRLGPAVRRRPAPAPAPCCSRPAGPSGPSTEPVTVAQRRRDADPPPAGRRPGLRVSYLLDYGLGSPIGRQIAHAARHAGAVRRRAWPAAGRSCSRTRRPSCAGRGSGARTDAGRPAGLRPARPDRQQAALRQRAGPAQGARHASATCRCSGADLCGHVVAYRSRPPAQRRAGPRRWPRRRMAPCRPLRPRAAHAVGGVTLPRDGTTEHEMHRCGWPSSASGTWARSTPASSPACPTSSWSASPTSTPTRPRPSPTGTAPAPTPTTARCSTRSTPPCIAVPTLPSPRRRRASSSTAASRCWSRSRSPPTLAQAEELVDARPARRGALLQVGHIERFNPAFEELCGRPLRPKFIECERHGPFTGRSTDIGVVLDLMIHDLDLLPPWTGRAVGGRRGAGRQRVRRARGRGQRPADVRQRLRRRPDRQPRQPAAEAAAADLGRRRATPASTSCRAG